MTVPFTHLHTHTPEGSLLDGFMRIEKAIAKAKSLGMDALGVSDHGTMAAHDKFYRLCKEAGIHPVLGMESYLTYDKSFKKEDFEAVELEQNDEGNYVFKFLMPDEIGEEFVPVRDFPTKKRQQEFQRMALKTYYLDLVTDSLLPGEELPTKVNARSKLAKSIAKTYEDQGYVLCVKGDAAQRNFFQWFPRSGHLLLIAKNNEGYQNLIRLNNAGQLEGFYIKPRVDYSDIKEYGKGIICTTACLGSIPNQLILKGRLDEAKAEIQRYVEAFDEVYLEIQPGQTEEQQLVNRTLIQWSEELNLPLIATSDAHMVDYDELPLHETLTNIGGQSKDDNDVSVYEWTYLMSAKEMLDFGIPEIALTNAYELSHRCQVDFLEDRTAKFPVFDVPEGHNFDSYLSELAYQGIFDLFMRKDYIKDYTAYQDRLEYELGVIKDKQISAYFLIVHDYINWARSQGIYIGPGRGSAAGSLVSYVLKLTNIDPLKYNLLFERFLNPERMSLPDIDIDFSYQRRHEVIDYLIEKYGVEHIANIGTYSQMSSKSILKNVGKVMGVDFDVVNNWNKEIPSPGGSPLKLADAIETIPTIQQASKQYPKLFDLALELEKMPKSSGIHACFDEDALVSTDQGLKRIVDIKVGDKVFTHKQRFKEVAKLMEYDAEEMFHLRASSMHPVRVTGNHPVYARRRYFKRDGTGGKDIKHKLFHDPRWVRVDDLTKEDYLGIPINLNSIIPSFEEYSLPFEQPEFWWLIGRYLGDGWTEHYDRVQKTGLKYSEYRVIICCTSKNDGELEEITSKLESLNIRYRIEQRGPIYKIHMSNPRDVYDYLQRFGRYANGKKLAPEVFDLPKDLVQSLLEGYFSADGHFIEHAQRKVVTTVSKELAVGVMQLIHKAYERPTSIGINPAQEGIINGRVVQHKKKYRISYTLKQSKYQRSFYEDGYIWTKVSQLEKEKVNQKVYNLTILDDSTYTVNNIAVHNSGYQVAPNNLMFNLPLMPGKKGEIITQYEGPVLEDLGYIKFDILGLKNLSVFEMAHDLILERHGIDLDINELTPGDEPGDEDVFKMIQNGDTLGLFQIEGEGITQVFTGLKEVNFDTLIAGVALYRPGPMANIPEYQARANGEKEIEYLTPELEKILSNTNGILVYQEQLMFISQVLGGYSPGQSDNLRKATGKKSQKVMDVELPKLHQAILDNGFERHVADEVIKLIEPFVGYGFNLSHAAAYAFVAYQCAYLKHHYPIEFFTALLSVFSDDKVKVSGYIQDARAHGIDVLRPDINLSDIDFNIASDNEIRYGLGSIHGLKDLAVTSILGIRPVSSLSELFSQVEKKEVDKTSVNALALSGAFDSFGETEESNRMEILSKAWMARGDNNADTIQEMLTFNNAKKLAYEKKYLGLYLTGHPLEGVAKPTDWSGFMESNNIVTAMGIIGAIKTIITKKGDPMAFVKVSFLEMEQDTVVFPTVWQSDVQLRKGSPILPLSSVLRPGLYVKVTGRFDADGGFLVNRFDIPLRLNAAFVDDLAELEETEGEAVPVEAPVEAPRMVFDEMF